MVAEKISIRLCGSLKKIQKFSTYGKGQEMLVLSRRVDESIVVGEDIEVRIVSVRGDRVRLGISAPKSVSVHRKEIFETIHSQKKQMVKK